MSLRDRILKASEIDLSRHDASVFAVKENKRLRPLIEALADLVVTAHALCERHGYHPEMGPCICGAHGHFRETLANLERVVGSDVPK